MLWPFREKMKILNLPSVVGNPVTLTFCFILILILMPFLEMRATPHISFLVSGLLLYTFKPESKHLVLSASLLVLKF